MMKNSDRFLHSPGNVAALAIFIQPTDDGTHAGILHRDKKRLWKLHLCWHEMLVSQPCGDNGPCCVQPDLLEEETNDVTAMCRLIHDRLQTGWQIPYAFKFDRNAYFSNVTGELFLPEGAGLSCSTFVLTVFASAGIHLVDVTDWQKRPEDIARHNSLLEKMSEGIPEFHIPPAHPEHVEKVRAEVQCIRVRPEEAAATGLFDESGVRMQELERQGKWVLHACDPRRFPPPPSL